MAFRVSLGVLAVGAAAWLGTGDSSAQTQPAPGQTVQRAPDRFTIEAFDVSGVTVLSAPEVERIVYPFAGPDKTITDVQGARKALQDAYAARGFEAATVDVPVQPSETFSRGIVQIAVNESPVGRVRVTGSKYHALEVVRAQVPSLTEGRPVDLKALQRDIATANQFPDRTVSPAFRPGQVPGTIDVDLAVQDDSPLHGRIELNNDYSPSTRPLRVSGTLRYSNLWQAGHTLSITSLYAPQRTSDSAVLSAAYVAPLIGTPWTLSLYGYKSNSNIAALGGANVLGNGYQIGARAIYRLPGAGQNISFGFDYKDFKQDITLNGVPAGSAPIRYVPLTVEYSISGATEHTSYSISAGTTFGLRFIRSIRCVVVAANQPCAPVDQFRQRENDSNENFVHFNLGIDYSAELTSDIVAAFKLAAQLADSHLITNEQFAAGGLTSVRGYLLSEAVGDDGITAGLDLRSPSFAALFGRFVTEARLYGFVDSGYVRIRSPLPDVRDRFSLVSAGVGGRLRVLDYFTGELVAGWALRDGPVTQTGDPRVTFVVRSEF